MSNPYGYTDRHGTPLAIGQRVRVQVCVGPYGRTAIREGVIKKFSPYSGMTLDTGYTTIVPKGYQKFEDFEHGHEKWTEIVSTKEGA
jgi:hypothetical protein